MNWKTIFCLVTVCLIAISAPNADGRRNSPVTDPHSFRNNLHGQYAAPSNGGPSALTSDFIVGVESARKAVSAAEEILISESVGPANFVQETADIVDLKGGRMIAAWTDYRSGVGAIYIQFMDDNGVLIGANSEIAVGVDDDLSNPALCADTSGHFYLVFRDEQTGFLRAQRFDTLGVSTGAAFYVSDTASGGYAGEFDAACLSDGRLAVVWEDYSSGNDIILRAFSAGGAVSIDRTVVNSDGLPVKHWSPSVAAGSAGDFAVVWEDYRSGTADIFFRLYNAIGVAYGPEFSPVDAGAPDSARYLPSVTFGSADGYVAAWVDLRDGQNIYMQQVDASGGLVGANRLLTDETSGFSNWEIDLDFTPGGDMAASWTLYGAGNFIMVQRYSAGLVKDGSPVEVTVSPDKIDFDPDVSGNAGGHAGIVWTGAGMGQADVFGAVCGSGPTVIQSEFVLNDDTVGSPSVEPEVVAFSRFDWTVVFTDKRRDGGDIMLQQLYVGGDLLGSNRMINADPPGGTQSQPAIASANDKLLVSWTDIRDDHPGTQNIVCRFVRPQNDLTPEIIANDDASGGAPHFDSDCAYNVNDIGLVVWTDTRTGVPKIYGQLFDAAFAPQGANFLIGPTAVTETGEKAVVSADSAGNFVVGFINRLHPSGPAVVFKRITGGGQLTDLFELPLNSGGFVVDGFDAGVGADNKIVLVWHGSKAGETALFIEVCEYDGTVISPATAVADSPDAMPGMPHVSVDNLDHILVTWMDHRTIPAEPYRQVYDAAMNPIEANVAVASGQGARMRQPAVAGYRGRGLFAWSDGRADGLNIYASQILYEPTDADGADDAITPKVLELAQNYPNPFNPTTTIEFTVPKSGQVRLDIFNLMGQHVRMLVDGTVSAGSHQVMWDGADNAGERVASGIYLYRLKKGDDIYTRKMTLVK